MTDFPRYALYYAPAPDSALARFGAEMLGYDVHRGGDTPFPDGVPPDWREVTQDPRKYGFHATLKAPMALAGGKSETALLSACEVFAATKRPLPLIEPVVDSISGFLAMIPAKPSGELQQLAADVTQAFDPFRAPLTAQDRARRNPDRLTPRQCDYLDRWGYPYVMEEFRFHMTLTCRLDAKRREAVLPMLRQRFAELRIAALPIDRLALFKQDSATERFVVIAHWPLATI